MEENIQFIQEIIDLAWFLDIAICSLSWVMLCRGPLWRWRRPGQTAAELLLMAAVITGGQLLIILLGGMEFYLLLQILLQGTVGAAALHFCSDCHKKSKLVMWCSMLAGSCAISSIGGQCSYLVGTFLSTGFAEGAIRTAVALLTLPLAVYLHSFNLQEHERVPISGLAAILIGDASIIAMNLLEVLYANTDYRITVTFLVSYIFFLLMVVAATQGIYDMCAEQNEIVELQAERQRLHSERELARMTADNLDDLRSIRHDLKNQYAYMQILLSQQRYVELEEYFRQSSQHLLPQLGQFIDCGNRPVNTVLNMEFAKARKEGVAFTHQLVVPPVLPFSEDDLCALLSNLLDNAIEECARLLRAGQGDVSLRLEIYPQKSYLFVLCRNTTSRTELARFRRGLRTTKGDDRLHGYGTRIISKIAEKYNGCAEFGLSDGMFVAKLLLDMTVEEKL
ncbi:MAG: GHKL domain-containing protein [Oscillospiraceae bacterium]|nr:GHKL domain-containing protein [Oscillospiraceae bacterium]